MRLFLATGIVVASLVAAHAQTPPANPNPDTPAVASPGANNPGAPAAGANSFTEAQARSRLSDAGFTNITGLAKDPNGVWRGKAAKGGATHDVSLDYQGNILPK